MNVNFACDYYASLDGQEVCHKAKDGHLDSLAEMAIVMATFVQDDWVLVPVPSSLGKATYTKTLAEYIGQLKNVPVVDCLAGNKRRSYYQVKKDDTVEKVGSEFFGFRTVQDIVYKGKIVLIDNVADTGATLRFASDACSAKEALVYARVASKQSIVHES